MHDLLIIDAKTPSELVAFTALCRAYAMSLPFSLEYQGFEAEMASLPGLYAAPDGVILIAKDQGMSIDAAGFNSFLGCVAVRPLPASAIHDGEPSRGCEIKRMWVDPAARSRGVGHAMMNAAIEFAKSANYGVIKLDTAPDMLAAQACYRKAGFVPAQRYNDDWDQTTMYFSMAV